MAFINKTAFEIKNSNVSRNNTQHVSGKYVSSYTSETVYTEADLSAGFLVVPTALTLSEGYEAFGVKNGNDHFMIAAANGTSGGRYGDHTGIYAFDNYDVEKAVNGDNQWNVGFKTLGLGLPAGNRGDFCELIVGENYAWGAGNHTAVPEDGEIYATIENGLLTPSSSAPAAGSGVYLELQKIDNFNEGMSYWGKRYTYKVCRAAETTVTSSELPEVTASDNGNVLTVVDGAWNKAALPSE